MGSPLKIREDRSPAELRRLARREADGRVAARLYAIANALDRTSRAEAARAAVILRGPEPDRDGCCAWTRGDLCRWMAAHFGKSYHPSSMTRVLRRMGFSRQKARPAHPKRDQKAQDRFEKRGYALP